MSEPAPETLGLQTHCQCCGKALTVYVEPHPDFDWTEWLDMAVCDECCRLRAGIQQATETVEPTKDVLPPGRDPYRDD